MTAKFTHSVEKISAMELKANEFSQEIIKDICSISISDYAYVRWIAKRLNCKISELRILYSLLPSDEEGWLIESFFPVGSEIKQTLLHSDVDKYHKVFESCFVDVSRGEVIEVEYKGKKLIADRNASPMVMYICERDIV